MTEGVTCSLPVRSDTWYFAAGVLEDIAAGEHCEGEKMGINKIMEHHD